MVAPPNPGTSFRSRGLTKVSPYGSSSKTPSFISERAPVGALSLSSLAFAKDGGGDARYAAPCVIGHIGGIEAEAAAGLVRVARRNEAGALRGAEIFDGARYRHARVPAVLLAMAKAKSAKVKMAPPMTLPSALRWWSWMSSSHTA